MAWNEPGNGKQRDPWQNGKNDMPDIGAWLKQIKDKFGGGSYGGGDTPGKSSGGVGIWLLIIGVLVVWFGLDSWRAIDETQRGVVLRLGKFNRVMPAGLNFKWPSPIESVQTVDVTNKAVSDHVRMLTRDENLVDIEFNVQYQVKEPYGFVFSAREPEASVQFAAESAVRQVVGVSKLDLILSGERTTLARRAQGMLQEMLDTYNVGILITELSFQNVRPPQEVKDAFDDAIAAREDKARLENEANAYASKVVPEARGQAARVRAEAEGYKQATIEKAVGESQRFTLLLDEYQQSKEVTRQRLFLDTMQEVLANNTKILVEGDGDKVIYLPLDNLKGEGTRLSDNAVSPRVNSAVATEATRSSNNDNRSNRGGR